MENVESQNPFLNEHDGKVKLTAKSHFKPWVLSTAALILLLLVTLGLLGLTEYAFHALPESNSHGIIGRRKDGAGAAFFQRRNDNFTSTVTTRVQGSLETLAITYEDPCPPGAICAPESQYWLAVGTVTLHPQKTSTSPSPSSSSSSSSQSLIYVFSQEQYSVGAFLPTLIAVLFSLPWLIIDSKIRNLEPFHQLSKNRGARARTTLFMDYLSPFVLVVPIKALFAGHWAPFLTSLLSISSILVTPLAPEFFSVRMQGSCDYKTTGCLPSLSISPAVGRAIEALLSFMAVVTILLVVHMSRYSTGIFAEPSSIAGIATLFSSAEVREDFRLATGNTPSCQASRRLAKLRYKLDFQTDHDGIQRYGLVPSVQSTNTADILAGELSGHQGSLRSVPERDTTFNRPHWKGALGLILLLSGLVAIIVYYKLTDRPDGFERFMDSQGFGVRFLFTAIGVIIKLYWGSIFREISILEPFSNLAKRSSTAQDSILMRKHSSPITAFASALTRRHFLVASVAFSAFLGDALTVCLSNIHFKTGTTFAAFKVVTWLSCSIIAVMLITLVRVALRRQPALPLKPTTIGAVLCYLCSSSIPRRLSNLETLNGRVRNRIVRDMDLRYGMWIQGGQPVIDVEPIDS